MIVGATPAGIAGALSAAGRGRRVILTEEAGRIGGLLTGGLSIFGLPFARVRPGSVPGLLLLATAALAQDTARMDEIVQSYAADENFMGSVLVARGEEVRRSS